MECSEDKPPSFDGGLFIGTKQALHRPLVILTILAFAGQELIETPPFVSSVLQRHMSVLQQARENVEERKGARNRTKMGRGRAGAHRALMREDDDFVGDECGVERRELCSEQKQSQAQRATERARALRKTHRAASTHALCPLTHQIQQQNDWPASGHPSFSRTSTWLQGLHQQSTHLVVCAFGACVRGRVCASEHMSLYVEVESLLNPLNHSHTHAEVRGTLVRPAYL